MPSLKFAFFTTFYPPYHFGGDAIGVQRLTHALARRGHEVTVVHDIDAYRTLKGPQPSAPAPRVDNLRVIGLESRHSVAANLLTHQLGTPVVHGGEIDRLLAEHDFDVIWHNNVSLVGGPGLLKRGRGLKVYEAHEHWLVCPTHVLWRFQKERCDARRCVACSLSYRRPVQLWRYTGALERALDHIDLVIAKSEFSRDKHREFGFPRDMTVIPYFLPAAQSEESAGAPPQERPYFLFVGRLEKIKGLQDVIPVFDTFHDADLIVLGTGEYEGELKALAAGNPRVKFLGRKSPEALAQYYQHARALIVPSICYETFGIIIIESFRIGAPVLARRLGPFPEIVEKCGGGMLFESREELAAALRGMVAEPERRNALSSKARAGFVDHWSEDVVVSQYFSALAAAAARKGDDALAARLEAC